MQFLPGGNIMQQPPYEQWPQWHPSTQYPPYQPPWQPPSQVVFMPQPTPTVKSKNETMKTFSILSFIGFVVLIGLAMLASGGHAESAVIGMIGCGGFVLFVA